MTTTTEIDTAARRVLAACDARNLTVATAESCTGGLVAGALTEIAGSSSVVMCGFVTYSNEAKHRMLGVRDETLGDQGAVSAETAKEMALGALARAKVSLSVAITGVAGPGGGSVEKPVGLVWFAAASADGRVDLVEKRFGEIGRADVRRASVLQALAMLEKLASAPLVG
jgi:nicotinamide-nucleotide amidase